MRNPNDQCTACGKEVYRRPNEKAKSQEPYRCEGCRKITPILCAFCGNEFLPKEMGVENCSRECANRGRKGIKYNLGHHNRSRERLQRLRDTFDFDSCMVEGCDYSTCYDIHRVIPGRDGGQYVIGNMFAICPNHHAEVERKIIRLDRQTDARLTVAVLKTAEGS